MNLLLQLVKNGSCAYIFVECNVQYLKCTKSWSHAMHNNTQDFPVSWIILYILISILNTI